MFSRPVPANGRTEIVIRKTTAISQGRPGGPVVAIEEANSATPSCASEFSVKPGRANTLATMTASAILTTAPGQDYRPFDRPPIPSRGVIRTTDTTKINEAIAVIINFVIALNKPPTQEYGRIATRGTDGWTLFDGYAGGGTTSPTETIVTLAETDGDDFGGGLAII